MRRVNVVGYYGWDNFGDELFRATVHRSRELIWGPSTRVRSFVVPVRALHQNLGFIGRVTRVLEAAIGVAWGDTVALCGGSVFEDVQGIQRTRGALLRRFGRRTEAIGVSLGPWKSANVRERVRTYVKQFDRLVVRDHASRDRLERDVTVGGDLAALYPMPTHPLHERHYLTICLSSDSRAPVNDVVTLLSDLLSEIEIPVKLLALNVRKSHGDVEFSQAIYDRLSESKNNIELLHFESVDQTIEVIAKSRAVWSQRLHGLIVAYLCDVSILALGHHQKIIDFTSDIDLPERFVRENLEPSGELRLAAAASLYELPSWGIAPERYRANTIAALSASSAAA